MDTIQVFILIIWYLVCLTTAGADIEQRYGIFNTKMQNIPQPNLLLSREIRAASTDPRSNCSTWSPWVDKHKPTTADNHEAESWTSQQIAEFCPALYGGTISQFECSDMKGEGFNTNKTFGSSNEFAVGCFDVHVGVTCQIVKPTSDTCPDLRIKYFCTCSSQVPLTTGSTTVHTTQGQSTKSSTGDDHSKTDETLNLGVKSVTWWMFILILCLTLFLINCVFTIYLYKRAVKKLKSKRKAIKVHPLGKV